MKAFYVAIYLPPFIFALGQGAILPVLADLTVSLGGSLAVSGIVAGGILIGTLLGDLPGGMIVSRFGEQRAMLMSAVVSLGAAVVCLTAASWVQLAIGVMVLGFSGATFGLARHTYMTVMVPYERRARSLSLLGGSMRIGLFLGPWLAVGLISTLGTQSVFYVHIAACLSVIAVLLLLPDPESFPAPGGAEHPRKAPPPSPSAVTSVRAHRHVLLRLGPGVSMLAAIRASKTILIPLWGVHIGLSAQQTALIVGISAGVELIPFYASGQIMDRFGRLGAILPCLIGLAACHVALPFAYSFESLLVVAVLLGFVNGIGSGIQLTLGSDIAPTAAPAKVLAAWRIFGDSGSAAAPLVVSWLIAVASLPFATLTLAGVGFVGAGLLTRYVPRFTGRNKRKADKVAAEPVGGASA
ncbi:MFS transporter [Saccharomonospora sp. NPDC046836]|uniref:MFS transporter n=1 Tax=Saccharomonospora sp. NPDC046836 TaxID=3156921 RepID=UPI0033EA0E62